MEEKEKQLLQTEEAPEDFLEKYASAAFHELAVKRGNGDKKAAEEIRRYVRFIEKKDAKPMEKYLHKENENKTLEALRKAYGKMQILSWISLILCALITFTVIGLEIFKPEILRELPYQIGLIGGAVLFAALTWIFSGIGGNKAHRMTELDLLLRVKDLPTEEDDEDEPEQSEEESEEKEPSEQTEEDE